MFDLIRSIVGDIDNNQIKSYQSLQVNRNYNPKFVDFEEEKMVPISVIRKHHMYDLNNPKINLKRSNSVN